MRIRVTAALALLAVASLASTARAQDSFFGITYEVSFPSDSTESFISDTSFRGIGIEWRKFFNYSYKFSIGFNAHWHVFDDRVTESVDLEGADIAGTLTGQQFRYINSVPLMLSLHYYLGNAYQGTRLYLGVNGGIAYLERRLDVGLFSVDRDDWQWTAAPEVGIAFPFDNSHFYVNGKYYVVFEDGDENPEQNYWSLSFGFAYAIY